MRCPGHARGGRSQGEVLVEDPDGTWGLTDGGGTKSDETQAELRGQRTRATSMAWKPKVESLVRGTKVETGSAEE